MHQPVFAAACFAFVATLAYAAPTDYRFEATIQIDQDEAKRISIELQPGQSRIVDIRPGLRIEFLAPVQLNTDAPTIVRLMNVTGQSPIQLHEAKRFGSATEPRQFTYGVCGGKVRFVSPSPEKPFACQT